LSSYLGILYLTFLSYKSLEQQKKFSFQKKVEDVSDATEMLD
jgi:hypothetical protein